MLWYSEKGTGRQSGPLLAVPNITAHPSTASDKFHMAAV